MATSSSFTEVRNYREETTLPDRRIVRDDSILDFVAFGIWDSHVSITPLQLQVAVSLALGARTLDDDIHVNADGESFFNIVVDHATTEEVEFIASTTFITTLNTQMSFYGAHGVLCKAPKLHRNIIPVGSRAA